MQGRRRTYGRADIRLEIPMKFNRIAGYLSQTDIAGQLIRCRLMISLGRKHEAQRGLIDLFEQIKPTATFRTGAATRRRDRILGDAAVWLGDSYAAESQIDHGVAFFRRMLKENPGCNALYRGLCRLIFPGDDYIRILKALHENIQPKFYVEIGVAKGDTLSCVTPSTDVVGVDPRPQVERRINSKISIVPETSDTFFAAYEKRPQFADRKIDMAFIDGLHHFEQALRDFINVEKRATADGLIVLHDCIPFDEVNSGRDGSATHWVGDVWKTLAVLLDHRPELNIKVIGAPPSGLVLVSHLNPNLRILEQQFVSLVDAYLPLRFADWECKYAPRIRIIPSHVADIARVLAEAN